MHLKDDAYGVGGLELVSKSEVNEALGNIGLTWEYLSCWTDVELKEYSIGSRPSWEKAPHKKAGYVGSVR
jgi:hypothetical protein